MRQGELKKSQQKIANLYIKDMIDAGWVTISAFGNTYSFEKPIDENCSHYVYVLNWLHAEFSMAKVALKTENLDDIDDASLVFIHYLDPICGNRRRAK